MFISMMLSTLLRASDQRKMITSMLSQSIHDFYFILQVQGNTNSMSPRDRVMCVPEVSQSSTSEYDSSQKKAVQKIDFGTSINEESDESDFEIFRVKRRSSSKVERRNAQNPVSVNSEHQVHHT